MFPFMDMLLIFLKYLRNVLFPRIVISAFIFILYLSFILYLCEDPSFLMTDQDFDISIVVSVSFCLWLVGKHF